MGSFLPYQMLITSQRIERTKRNSESAKERSEKRKKALEVLHKDDN
jgi:predicted RNA-binding protein with EMAP domain